MKYISLIDELGITLNDIIQMDATQIIRIQKQLKAKAVLENKSNLGELSELVSQLENQEIKEAHLFVESHPWLKNILLGKPEELTQKAFESTYNPRPVAAFSKIFISPFLVQTLKKTLSYILSKGRYHLLVRLVSQERFFTEEVRQLIITFFVTRLNYANSYMAEGKLKESSQPIYFLRNSEFIDSLNVYIDSIMDEVTEVNSTIIEVYNSHLKTINHEWEFAAAAMVAFGRLKPPNPYQQEVFEKNADIAKSSMSRIDFTETDEKGSYTSNGGNSVFMIVRIIVIIFIVIRAIVSFSDDGPSYNDYYNDTIDFQRIITANERNQNKYSTDTDSLVFGEEEIEETIIESTEEYVEEYVQEDTKEKNAITVGDMEQTFSTEYTTLPNRPKGYKQDSHIRFLYSLKRKVSRGDNKDPNDVVRITPFTNPYPKSFNPIEIETSSGKQKLTINNDTQKELIIFRLKDGVDQAIIIPKNDNAVLNFKEGDSIAFYAGNDFEVSKFSNFSKRQDISHLYKITSLNTSSRIDVMPFKVNTNETRNLRYKRVESLKFYNTKMEELEAIEALYKDFYDKYYR